ncbi:MAG: hypothetical protein GX591_04680 [Planctomycetes bacterium]|nr:hypothetical protein [Planctomycetota bacterium]
MGRFYRLKRTAWLLASTWSLSGLYNGRICRSWLRFTHMDMPLPDLPAPLDGKRVVHISDVHCSPLVRDNYLTQVFDYVAELDADFLVVSGDLITGGIPYARRIARLLSRIPVKVARLACLGNHDYGIYFPCGRGKMRQLPEVMSEELRANGTQPLRNEAAVFEVDGGAVQFVGLEDYWSGRFDPDAAFRTAHRSLPTICLCHNPDATDELARDHRPHWVLAGHTHGHHASTNRIRGRVLPIESRDYPAGHYTVGPTHLYVNRGLSYARRVSVNRRPEITVFTLRKS